MKTYTVEALVSGNPRDGKKVSVTGAGRLREWLSETASRGVRDRWLLTGASPANNKHWECKTIPPHLNDFLFFLLPNSALSRTAMCG